jgi:integrase
MPRHVYWGAQGKLAKRQAQSAVDQFAHDLRHAGLRFVADPKRGCRSGHENTIWSTKPETAARVRGRIERILDWAKVRGFRAGENPARWRGHLDVLLPARNKVRQVGHHAALPYSEIGAFMAALRDRQGTATRALEFAILTAARTSEVLGAGLEEINLQGRVWTVPPDRMKAGREHRVPLSRDAVALLKKVRGSAEGLVFPGERRGKPLSNMAMLMVLRRMGRTDLTAHGFRSTFRDWAAECTSFPREVAEAALAHVVGDKVEAAYRRGDLFEKRRRLMEAWARHCVSDARVDCTVTALKGKKAVRA